jgi:hypothetical protein
MIIINNKINFKNFSFDLYYYIINNLIFNFEKKYNYEIINLNIE